MEATGWGALLLLLTLCVLENRGAEGSGSDDEYYVCAYGIVFPPPRRQNNARLNKVTLRCPVNQRIDNIRNVKYMIVTGQVRNAVCSDKSVYRQTERACKFKEEGNAIEDQWQKKCEGEPNCDITVDIARHLGAAFYTCRLQGTYHLRIVFTCDEEVDTSHDDDDDDTGDYPARNRNSERRRSPSSSTRAPETEPYTTSTTTMRTTASTAASTTSRTREEPHVGARSNTEPSANPGGQLGGQQQRPTQAEVPKESAPKTTTKTQSVTEESAPKTTTKTQSVTVIDKHQTTIPQTKKPRQKPPPSSFPRQSVLIGASVGGGVLLLIVIATVVICVRKRKTMKRGDRSTSKTPLNRANETSQPSSERYISAERQYQGAAPLSTVAGPALDNGGYQTGTPNYDDHNYLELMDETRLQIPHYQPLESGADGGVSNNGYVGLTVNQYEELANYQQPQSEMSNRRLPALPKEQ